MTAVCQDTDPQQNVSRANRIGVYVLYPEVKTSNSCNFFAAGSVSLMHLQAMMFLKHEKLNITYEMAAYIYTTKGSSHLA